MKFILTVFSILVLHASASFFDDMRGTFQPLEYSVGKLVTDVVSDLREAIDCTILAVENVFSLGGLFGVNSEYERRCKGETNDYTVTPTVQDTAYTQKSETDNTHHSQTSESEILATGLKEANKELSEHISESITDARQTIEKIIEKNDAQERIENVKSSIKNETDRLGVVSKMIRQKIDNLSTEIKSKFNILDIDSEEVSVQQVLKHIGTLYKVEQSDKSSSQANEIRHLFDTVLDILRLNDTGGGSYSDDDEVKEILKNLESSENVSLIDIENQLSEWKGPDRQINKSQEIGQGLNIHNEMFNEGSTSGVRRSKTSEIMNSLAEKIAANKNNIDITKNFQNTANRIMEGSPIVDTDQIIKATKDVLNVINQPKQQEKDSAISNDLLNIHDILEDPLEQKHNMDVKNSFLVETSHQVDINQVIKSTEEATNIFSQLTKQQGTDSVLNSSQEGSDNIFEDTEQENQNIEVTNSFQNTASPTKEESNAVDTDQIVKSIEEASNIFSQATEQKEKNSNDEESLNTIFEESKLKGPDSLVLVKGLSNIGENPPISQNAPPLAPLISALSMVSSTTTTTVMPEYSDFDTAGPDSDDLSLLSKLFDSGSTEEDKAIFNKLFGYSASGPQTETGREDAVKEAENIIKQSRYTNKVMDNFFNNVNTDSTPNVFDNPELLNYRKK